MIGVYEDRPPASMTVQDEMREDTPIDAASVPAAVSEKALPVSSVGRILQPDATDSDIKIDAPQPDVGAPESGNDGDLAALQEEEMDPRDLSVVKWYKLSDKEQWEDYGTGVVHLQDVTRLFDVFPYIL